ncbi:MAG: strawberry notch-like NTP hydrolase domain-containing protein [Isosphaeraceae bacterium]
MGCSVDALGERLSFDQQDSVWLAYSRLLLGESFLLGDETGYGKGRTLAAVAWCAARAGRQVLMITEKANLLSDFYRDVLAVCPTGSPIPVVLHRTARVLDPDGAVVVAPKDNRLPQPGDVWVWTTYAQFNRADKKKIAAVKSWMSKRPTVLILDEAQNAAGDSSQGKVMRDFQRHAVGTVFSSATPIKNEDQLAAYRSLMTGDDADWTRLRAAMSAGGDTLRTALTLSWAEQGVFVRREHPPMDLPDPVWVPRTDFVRSVENTLADWWFAWVNAVRIWSAAAGQPVSPWSILGGSLSRAMREAGMWLRRDVLLNEVRLAHHQGKKSVIVADWTLSSHAARLIERQKEAKVTPTAKDGSDEISDESVRVPGKGLDLAARPLWRDSWAVEVNEVLPDSWLADQPPVVAAPCRVAKDLILAAVAKLPDWSISPFDDVAGVLEREGIRVSEISGRSWQLNPPSDDHPTWALAPRTKVHRSLLVAAYNRGDSDVVLLTRAGNSGISLHAGVSFADQRPRHLIEWDVAPDPAVRLQFWGRVRRKDQVCEPTRVTLVLDTPAERRRWARDSAKQIRLAAHGGSMPIAAAATVATVAAPSSRDSRQEAAWIGRAGSLAVREWLQGHPHAASQLDPWPDASVEKVLARAVILPEDDRLALMLQVERSLDLDRSLSPSSWSGPSCVVRSAWWWGMGIRTLTWQERIWSPQPTATADMVLGELAAPTGVYPAGSLPKIVARWSALWAAWWSKEPVQETAFRRSMLDKWTRSAHLLDRSQGIEVVDPATGVRTRALILGAQAPETSDPRLWSASQIAMTVWLATRMKPLVCSLSALIDPHRMAARPAASSPQKDWFSGEPWIPNARVLSGPAWSIAAWGVRHRPEGVLVALDQGSWGWAMPSSWDWSAMESHNRELASPAHAQSFWRDNSGEPVFWRWAPDEMLTVTSQADGLFLEGDHATWEHISFPLRQLLRRMVLPTRNFQGRSVLGHAILPHSEAPSALYQWFASGASPEVGSAHAPWVAQTFAAHERF